MARLALIHHFLSGCLDVWMSVTLPKFRLDQNSDWNKINISGSIIDRATKLCIQVCLYQICIDLNGQGHRLKPINADHQIRSMLIDLTKSNIENTIDRVKELHIQTFLYKIWVHNKGQGQRSKADQCWSSDPIYADRLDQKSHLRKSNFPLSNSRLRK